MKEGKTTTKKEREKKRRISASGLIFN